jgi:hypothetical protein
MTTVPFTEINLKIQTSEFSQDIIDKIRQFLSLNGESDVIISIRPKKKKSFPKESKEDYFNRLDKAIDNLENNRNLMAFTATEFQEFAEAKL